MAISLTKHTFFSSLLATSLLPTMALAQPQEGFTITPSIGYYNMDNDRDIKDDEAYSIGLGYQFDSPWAVEFVYLNADSDLSNSSNGVDVDQYRLDALYHLPTTQLNLTPYLAAGVGVAEFSDAYDSDESQINAGGGLKYALNDRVSLRADFRLLNDLEDHHLDHMTSVGVQIAFGHAGQTEADQTTQPEPVAETTVEETVVEEPSPLEQAETVEVQPPVIVRIQFAHDSAEIDPKFYPEIEKLAEHLKEYPNSTAIVEGHADDTGEADYNQTLSEQRAQAITDVLVDQLSISDSRVSAIGYGENKPLFKNDTDEHRQANRRVKIIISSDTI